MILQEKDSMTLAVYDEEEVWCRAARSPTKKAASIDLPSQSEHSSTIESSKLHAMKQNLASIFTRGSLSASSMKKSKVYMQSSVVTTMDHSLAIDYLCVVFDNRQHAM
jgi:hypothetical protein